MTKLDEHFIKNLLERLREEAHPDGCPWCEDLEGDQRCFGCAELLATVDAVENTLTENERLWAVYEAVVPLKLSGTHLYDCDTKLRKAMATDPRRRT